MDRPRTSGFIATSLDGFIARRDGGIDWLSIVEREGEDYGYAAFAATIDALLIGRATYDVARAFPSWPYAGKRVFVLSSRPLDPVADEVRIDGTPSEALGRCSEAGARHVYVDGGAVLRSFLEHDLLDELTLSVVPIVLGDGRSLLTGLRRELRLEVVRSRAYESGLVQTTYRPLR